MKKATVLLAALCSAPAFAQVPALAIPAISLAPLAPLLALAPGVLPANIPSLGGIDANGTLYFAAFGRGAEISATPSQGLPFTVKTVGIPIPPALAGLKLPGLP